MFWLCSSSFFSFSSSSDARVRCQSATRSTRPWIWLSPGSTAKWPLHASFLPGRSRASQLQHVSNTRHAIRNVQPMHIWLKYSLVHSRITRCPHFRSRFLLSITFLSFLSLFILPLSFVLTADDHAAKLQKYSNNYCYYSFLSGLILDSIWLCTESLGHMEGWRMESNWKVK